MKKSYLSFAAILLVVPIVGGCKGGSGSSTTPSIDVSSTSEEPDSRHYVSSYAPDDHEYEGYYIPKDSQYHYRYCTHHEKYDGEEEHDFEKTPKSEVTLDTSTLDINDVTFDNYCSTCGYRFESTENPKADWKLRIIDDFKANIDEFDVTSIKEFKCSESLYPSSISCYRSEEGFYVDANGHEQIEMGEILLNAYIFTKGLDNFDVYRLPSYGYLLEKIDGNYVTRVHFDELYRVLEVRSYIDNGGHLEYGAIYTFTYGEGREIHVQQLDKDYIQNLFTYSVKTFSKNGASLVIESSKLDEDKLVINGKYGIYIENGVKYLLNIDGDYIYSLKESVYQGIEDKSFATLYENSTQTLLSNFLKDSQLFDAINAPIESAKESSFLDNGVLYTKLENVWVAISLDRNQLLNDISIYQGDKVIDVERISNIEDMNDFSFTSYWVEPEKEEFLSYDREAHWRYSVDHNYRFEYELHVFNNQSVKYPPSFYGGNITSGTKTEICDVCGYSHDEDLKLSEVVISEDNLLTFLSTSKDLSGVESVEYIKTYNDETQDIVSYDRGSTGFNSLINSSKATSAFINGLKNEGYTLTITKIYDDLGNGYNYCIVKGLNGDVGIQYNINELGLIDYSKDSRDNFSNAYYWEY